MGNIIKKRGQEEIVGFALIVIIIAVVFLLFLGFSLNNGKREAVESYEIDSFIQAFLQYTTNCSSSLEYLSVRKLVFSCDNAELCEDERDSCEVLNRTLKSIIEEGWKIGDDRPLKGYEMGILSEGTNMIRIREGNITPQYKGAMQPFTRRGKDYEITFKVYY